MVSDKDIQYVEFRDTPDNNSTSPNGWLAVGCILGS